MRRGSCPFCASARRSRSGAPATPTSSSAPRSARRSPACLWPTPRAPRSPTNRSGPPGPGNAIAKASHPNIDALLRGPHAQVEASGRAVGLPDGVMGNSEVGHLTIGAGYAQRQDLVRINDDISSGAFFRNPVLAEACTEARERRTSLHLMGLISDGGVHADVHHLEALLELAHAE